MQPDNLGPLALSLAKAQAEFPTIPRDRTVTVKLKTGGSYSFSYAPLDTIIAAVRPALSKNGLAFAQLLDGGDLVTMLLHESGAVIEGRVVLPQGNGDVQSLGSAITYLRRYALQAILGVASEEDDDGNASAGNTATPTRRPDRVQDAVDAEQAAAEAYAREQAARRPQPVQQPPGVPQADIASLHAEFTPLDAAAAVWSPEELVGIEPSTGLTTGELFQAAEDAGIPKSRLTLSAKTMFGVNRWKVTDLTNEERAQLWEEVAPVPA